MDSSWTPIRRPPDGVGRAEIPPSWRISSPCRGQHDRPLGQQGAEPAAGRGPGRGRPAGDGERPEVVLAGARELAALGAPCRKCSARLAAAQRFCGECGAPVLREAGAVA
jgi:hypothetical protein